MELVEQLMAYPAHFLIAIILVLLAEVPIAAILDSISHRIQIDAPAGVDAEKWKTLVRIPGKRGGLWIGVTERLLFFVALWASAPLLVAAWLAFKVASKWEAWTNLARVPAELDDAQSDLDYFIARTRWSSRTMQRFLVGTSLNLLAAIIGLGIFYLLVELQPCIFRC